MTEHHEPDSAVRGRPRDPARETEILEAALELVAELGYDRVSMDAVATACQASKATLYRRWPSKAAMVAAAVRCRHQDVLPPVDTGELRQDLLVSLTRMTESMSSEDIGLFVGLLNAIRTDPDLGEDLRSQLVADKRAGATAWTQRAIERGQLRPGTDLDLVHQIGPALVMFRLLLTGEPVDEQFRARLVDEVLLPLVERHAPDSPERTPTS